MSNAAINAVFADSISKGVARLVLLSIADRADERGKAFCGVGDICRRTNASRGQVFAAINSLKQLGELTSESFAGPNRCNVYRLGDRLKIGPSEIQTVRKSDSEGLDSRLKGSGNQTQTPINPKEPQRGARTSFDPRSLTLPFSSESFRTAWDDWIQHRIELRKPVTATAAAKQLKQFEQMGEAASIASIETSVRNGWRGIFPDKAGQSAMKAAPERRDIVSHKTPPRVVT